MTGIIIENKHTYTGNGHYVGRPSPLGNPHDEKEHGRIKCIELFRGWLYTKLKNHKEGPQSKLLYSLLMEYQSTGKLTLICWCYPKPCHAEVIANAIRFFLKEELKPYSWKLRIVTTTKKEA